MSPENRRIPSSQTVPLSQTATGEGLSWSWHLDLDDLITTLSAPAPWHRPSRLTPRPPDPSASRATNLPAPNPADPSVAQASTAQPSDGRATGIPPRGTQSRGTQPADIRSDDIAVEAAPDSASGDPAASDSGSAAAASPCAAPAVPPADPLEADFAEYLDAIDAGRTSVVPLPVAAGRVAETLPTSPDLAGWLACSPAGELEDGALAGVAAGYRRLTAWAQAGELAAVAEMASRSAAADKYTSVDDHGRPGTVPADAYGQVSLALTLSHAGAQWWTNLAVDLQWRLPGTGLALREGVIDLDRAKAIAEATAALDDAKARAVEEKILPRAGHQTISQLRASLRRAVIIADPDGAERRRQEAERRARVVLYPDAEGTATLTGQNLPSVRAAAAYARLTALARALKASGAEDGIDRLRSKVLLGLLLGTLPYIPPPPDSPPDPDAPRNPDTPPDDDGRPDNGDRPDTGPTGSRSAPDDASRPHLDDWPWNNDPAPRKHKPASGHHTSHKNDPPHQDDPSASDSARQGSGPQNDGRPENDSRPGKDSGNSEPVRDAGAAQPNDDASDDQPGCDPLANDGPEPLGEDSGADSVPWPEATTFLPPGPAALKNLQPAGSGYLDMRLPWLTLTQGGPEPGYLTRLGPITPAQASYLALLAAEDPAVEWRVVITDATGRAIAVTRTRTRPATARASPVASTRPGSPATPGNSTRPGGPATPASSGNPHGSASHSSGGPSSLLRRIIVVISTDELSVNELSTTTRSIQPADDDIVAVAAAIITAARTAADKAAERGAADTAAGGCAHTQATAAYQVPARLRDYITFRDLTCRFPTCGQPAWHCDIDHTKPHDQGGPTCLCNLGPLCRYHHHQIKQHPDWHLDQTAPGIFTWTTPTGRTYTIEPDLQAA